MAYAHNACSAAVSGLLISVEKASSSPETKLTGVGNARRHSGSSVASQVVEGRVSRSRASLGLCETLGGSSVHAQERSFRSSKERSSLGGHDVKQPSRSRQACAAGPGAMEEALFNRDNTNSYLRDDEPSSWWERTQSEDATTIAKPGSLVFPKFVNDRADDVALHNPLKRLERLGCGWFAVLLEWEGVIVEDDPDIERKSWAMLAEEEGKPQPPGFLLRRADGMKNEQIVMEVFCWSREYRTVKRMAQRRDEIYEELQGGCYRLRPGSKELVDILRKHNTPVAVVSTRPRRLLERAIDAVGMEGVFDLIVSAEDVQRGKPDPEMFLYAATCLKFIPERCIVVGNSNSTVEAAHDGLMKAVSVVGKFRAYELGASDLVVSRLDDLSIVDLKNLADLDSVEFSPPMELEPEPEEERPLPLTKVAEW